MEHFFGSFTVLNENINLLTVFIRVALAVLFGGIIGNERGKHGSQAGLRTHILVCLGATMTALIGIYSVEILEYNGDPFRIAAQVVSGIGFLGAGMIIVKGGNVITGLTTAAGMWTTATIGIALGIGFYSGAVLVMLACVFAAAFLTRIERKRKQSTRLYVELDNLERSGDITACIRQQLHNNCLMEVLPAKSGIEGHLGVFIIVSQGRDCREEIEAIDGVSFAIVE